MDEREIRLQAMQIATGAAKAGEDVVELATRIAAFINGPPGVASDVEDVERFQAYMEHKAEVMSREEAAAKAKVEEQIKRDEEREAKIRRDEAVQAIRGAFEAAGYKVEVVEGAPKSWVDVCPCEKCAVFRARAAFKAAGYGG